MSEKRYTFAKDQLYMFSKACEYGIKAIIFIAVRSQKGQRANLKEISEGTDSPMAFTSKILQVLVRSGILDSLKGPTGGFFVSKEKIDTVTLFDIVYAIDGDTVYNGCGLGLKQCDANRPCPVHDKFVVIRSELKSMLMNTSIYELTTGLETGLTHLKR